MLAIALDPTICEAQTPIPAPVAAISFAPQLGDVEANIAAMHSLARDAIRDGARIIVFPELATSGYGVETWPAPRTLAIAQPFSELSALVDLAKQHAALIVVGVAERDGANLYNSAVVIEPSGRTSVQRKRWSFTGSWHQRSNTPIEVYRPRWGTVAVAICADTFHMESSRIAALKGADILLVPANWWGLFEQLSLWQTRARENGVWLVVANRLGGEPATTGTPGAVQDMPLAYEPALDAAENLETLKREFSAARIPRGALVVLPGLGLSETTACMLAFKSARLRPSRCAPMLAMKCSP